MNPAAKSAISIIFIGSIFTFLLYWTQLISPVPPEQDLNQALDKAKAIETQLTNKLQTNNNALETLTYNSYWQNAPVSEWNFWLEAQKPLFYAAGFSLIGVHTLANDTVYFEKASLPGQYAELKKPLAHLYKTQALVNVLQQFRSELVIITLAPIKSVKGEMLGALIGIESISPTYLKQIAQQYQVPVAVVSGDDVHLSSDNHIESVFDYHTTTIGWPKSIQSSLWSMVLVMSSPPFHRLPLLSIIIGILLTALLLIMILKQLAVSRRATRLLKDTIDLQLPVSEQISRLTTLQRINKDADINQVAQAVIARVEQLLTEKKSLNLEVKRLKESERQLNSKITHLKTERDTAFAAPKLKSEFLSRMGDEITTPMKSVVSMLKLLSEYQFDAEPKQLLNIAKRSTRTLVDNLNNILDFSKLDAGMLKLSKSTFRIRELVDDLSSELSHYANDKGLSLQASTDPQVPAEINADAFRIKQILRNLLGNAIRFTKQGEVSLYADIIETDNRKMLRFTVKDTGVGIPQEAQKDLFKSLEQATKLTNSSFAGRLRLIVSHHLTELMGGEIGVISESGKGSQFWFTVAI
ncbi:sensor histidine kinase [Aliikangiella maris]|uniref:ATP-binding protein n=2 Tax=Aliikangiella maris TaxID=3162458 RepID=A0ABV2BTA1_9GAMM